MTNGRMGRRTAWVGRLPLLVLLLISGGTGCALSEIREDPEAGMNGSFEVVRDGLPVNWFVYTPDKAPSGDWDMVIDTVDPRSGRQSLQFVVRECLADGGWHSPGLTQEFEADPGATYTVGFWVKNSGAVFRVNIGGVTATRGDYITVHSDEEIDAWRYLERSYTVGEDHDRLRFEFNVLRPGTVWIDDVTIVRNP